MRQSSPDRIQRREQRIRDIARQINRLSEELRTLTLEEDFPPVAADPPPQPHRPPPPPLPVRHPNPHATGHFLEDDRIVITNNRNGLRGHRGTVTDTNARFVWSWRAI